MARPVLCVFPTAWDRPQLEVCRSAWEREVELDFTQPSDEEALSEFDVLGFIDAEVERGRGRLAGVLSSSDYPGATAAAAIATALGLPGSRPEDVMRASHKYYSRIVQREAAPEAVPAFAALDPDDRATWNPSTGFPCFVKPVKGAFSVMARMVHDADELAAFLSSPEVAEFRRDYVWMFNRLVARYGDFAHDGGWFVAEEPLAGDQVTVEGWATRDGVEILGIVDSIFHPGTRSFARFDYPSRLSGSVQARMADVVRRVVARLGLVDTLFNVELVHDAATDRTRIIEVNPRICGQFADLYHKVDGTSGYEIALALCRGRRPRFRRGAGRFTVASSVPLRVFEPVRVVRAPDEADVRRVEAAHPGTKAWTECRTGDTLLDFRCAEDGQSARYAVLNVGARSRAALDAEIRAVQAGLGFELEPARA
jgi:hypothetical protein